MTMAVMAVVVVGGGVASGSDGHGGGEGGTKRVCLYVKYLHT